MTRITQQQLESYLWGAAVLLRGTIDAGDYKQFVKKFADDSGHTAAEFYTNRTVVHLMTEMLDMQPGESVYDPTCGSGGMLPEAMEACVVVCRTQKPKARRGKILFINAVNEVTRERAQSFLTDEHLQRVVRAYQDFKDEPGFTRVVSIEEIRAKEGNLSIPLYVGGETQAQTNAATETAATALPDALKCWLESSSQLRNSLSSLLSSVLPR